MVDPRHVRSQKLLTPGYPQRRASMALLAWLLPSRPDAPGPCTSRFSAARRMPSPTRLNKAVVARCMPNSNRRGLAKPKKVTALGMDEFIGLETGVSPLSMRKAVGRRLVFPAESMLATAVESLRCVYRAVPTIEVLGQLIRHIDYALTIEQVHSWSQGRVKRPICCTGHERIGDHAHPQSIGTKNDVAAHPTERLRQLFFWMLECQRHALLDPDGISLPSGGGKDGGPVKAPACRTVAVRTRDRRALQFNRNLTAQACKTKRHDYLSGGEASAYFSALLLSAPD